MLFRFPSLEAATAAILLSVTTVHAAPPSTAAEIAAARDHIKPAAIAAHIRFLADDLLEGRETGSRGFELGARYVAAQFASAGLQAAGDGGSFFQKIDLRSARLVADRSSVAIDDGSITTLAANVDALVRPDFARAAVDVRAPAVFAGFGIVAPELGRDDYAGLDARGKIVVYLSGAPPSFPNNQRAYYSSSQVKESQAAAHGAVGVLVVKSNADELRYPFEKSVRQSDMVAMRRLDDGQPADFIPQLRGLAMVSRAAAQKLFAHAPRPIDQLLAAAEKGEVPSFPLHLTVAIHTASSFDTVHSENVVAMLPGSDPNLRDEYVVLSAHLDHLGQHGSATGDTIFNGAFDNASGIACLLEIARAFASLPTPPARSILFAAFTGEEKGEEGSGFLARHPPQHGTIVADVNMDMFLMLYPVKDLVPFGGEHSTLGTTAREAASAMGFELSPDPNPEEVRFIRSDQYAFVRQGIPAIILKAGSKSTDPSIDAEKASRDWLRTIYHTTKDDLSQPMDFASGARYAQTNFLLALAIANDPLRPRWNAGDFFGDRFGHAHIEAAREGGR
jgi:Zn-dependent M28 family amino/carboxypeptidase